MSVVSADEQVKQAEEDTTVNGLIIGEKGLGKTSLLLSLEGDNILFVDLEAGSLAVKGWDAGKRYKPLTWRDCQDLACYLAGPDLAANSWEPYSEAHYNAVMAKNKFNYKDLEYIFVDSMTAAARLCAKYAEGHKETWPDGIKGKRNGYAFWAVLKRELIDFANRMQRVPKADVWLLALMDVEENEGIFTKSIQFESKKAGSAFFGIFDEILTMSWQKNPNSKEAERIRTFCTKEPNPYGFVGKDRSGALRRLEPADLGGLIRKIKGTDNRPSERVKFTQF